MAEPPSFSAQRLLLNVTPRSSHEFCGGFLGSGKVANLVGEVQLKWTSTPEAVSRIELCFTAIERGPDGQEIELLRQRHLLWDQSAAGPSTAEPAMPPSSLPFDLELTPDLPHCIHQADSELSYSLRATVMPLDQSNAVSETVPVHLTRYEPPDTVHNEDEAVISREHPMTIRASLCKTIYRRSEAIEIRVRIPPPSDALVRDKGVRLRSVGAELVRVIRVGETTTRTLLSHSGKLCRFSANRDIFLRLWLQPPSSEFAHAGCETITQGTILHDISFLVRIVIVLSGREGDREDVTLEQAITVVPDAPPVAGRTDKQRERAMERAHRVSEVEAVPAYRESPDGAGPSTQRSPAVENDDEAEEYDGYEQSSIEPASQVPPPPIEEDESPPELFPAATSSPAVSAARPPLHVDDISALALAAQASDLSLRIYPTHASIVSGTDASTSTEDHPVPLTEGEEPPEYANHPASSIQPSLAAPPAYSFDHREGEATVRVQDRLPHGVV